MTSLPEGDEADLLAEAAADEPPPLEVLEVTGPVAYLASQVKACSDAKLAQVRSPATADSRGVKIDCHLTLQAGDVVTRQLILEGPAASGVTVDCNGALLDGGDGKVNDGKDMIEIRSRKTTDEAGQTIWQRPEGITVRDCRIEGSMRIYGMGKNGEAPDVRESSRRSGHVTRVRANAPRRITLQNLTITGHGRTPLYLSPGVTYVKLESSELKGDATSVGLYLDAESARNEIRDNYLHVTSRQEYVGGIYTRKREEIAVDGSSYNLIVNNRLSTLEGGGVYLYRNCGEGGTVRHSQPSHNQIINNVFYYNQYDGDNPAIFIGSRDNDFWEGRWYCGDDSGFPWGSSVDDRSFARYTVVMQNQIYKRSLSDMIKFGDSSNSPSYLAYNQTVTTEAHRRAGCYLATGYKNFIFDGQTLDVYKSSGGTPVCTGYQDRCSDGTLSRSTGSGCLVQKVTSDCRVTGSNAGCARTAYCPSGTRLVSAAAACNLEWGEVSSSQLSSVRAGEVQVVRNSDHVSDGRCRLGTTTISSGHRAASGFIDADRVSFACSEHDSNGGDCHVKAALFCR